MNTFTTPSEALEQLIFPALGDDFNEEDWNLEGLEEELIEAKEGGAYGMKELDNATFESIIQAHEA